MSMNVCGKCKGIDGWYEYTKATWVSMNFVFEAHPVTRIQGTL